MIDKDDLIELGRAVLETEAEAITSLGAKINESFADACRILLGCKGRAIVIGMGKSGHIGGKIASTLASTGTPAFFVHPAEASHGDLGMITGNDVVVALSNSGETEEILTLLPVIKRLGTPLIALTGNPDSSLAQNASVNIDIAVDKEACPLDLAPTASTTAALAMGDALAIALLQQRGFKKEDFALKHPGGNLGRKLLLRVFDIMHSDREIPAVNRDTTVKEALHEMSAKGLGVTVVLSADGRVEGIFTDGDIRRAVDSGTDLNTAVISDVMTRDCSTIAPELLAAEALKIMEDKKINALPVVNREQMLVGIINMHDLLRARVV